MEGMGGRIQTEISPMDAKLKLKSLYAHQIPKFRLFSLEALSFNAGPCTVCSEGLRYFVNVKFDLVSNLIWC
jgi:hypothetical protein